MESEQKDIETQPTKHDVVLYIVRKTERIVSTTQILCNLITDNKDMAEIVRKKTFPVLEVALALRSSRTAGIEDSIIKIKDDLASLEVYLATAALSHAISGMNARLVREEIFNLIEYISTMTPVLLGERSAGVHISRGMFAVEEFEPVRSTGSSDRDAIILTSERDALIAQRQERGYRSAPPVPPYSVPHRDKGHVVNDRYDDRYDRQPVSPEQSESKKTSDTKRKSDWQQDRSAIKQKSRRLDILSILQKKDSITIKDVAEVITDCSEKTLQRELLSMVESGVLKKEGERRWSTYALA